MSITKSNILTFTNSVLHRSDTDIDIQVQSALDDLSQGPYIEASDTDQTLTSDSEYLEKPTKYFSPISITVHDGSNWLAPLKALPGGYKEYRMLMGHTGSVIVSDPKYYAEFGGYFWLYPQPGQSYTSRIDFYKLHGTDLDNIEFSDEWLRAIQLGAAFEVACQNKMISQIEIWGARYEAEKEKQRLAHPGQPRVIGT